MKTFEHPPSGCGPDSFGRPERGEVDEADMRAVVRLLGEVAALPGGLLEKKCALLDGLCDFAGAEEWRWAVFRTLGDGSEEACELALSRRIAGPGVPALGGSDPSPAVLSAGHLPPSCAETHVLLSEREIRAGIVSRIALCRDPRGRDYSDRERNLALLVFEEIPWLHFREWSRARPLAKLPPRQQLVFDLLLTGSSRKEIASKLDITLGTVSGYCRLIYERLGVNSQSELLRVARFQPSSHS